MHALKLTLACGDYDRTRALQDGTVRVDGVDLNYIVMGPGELFFRMARYAEFGASEMSLSTYIITLASRDPPFVAIPVFPSRAFRQSCVYVNSESGVKGPEDLKGRRVGVAQFQATANVWLRGIMEDVHKVPVSSPTYYLGGLELPTHEERTPLKLPKKIRTVQIGRGKTLNKMLEDGEIDALYTPDMPSCFARGSPKVRRLFPDFGRVEAEYYRATRIFPIMHTLVLRRDVYSQNRWVALSLFKAFSEAKRRAEEQLRDVGALKATLPWLWAEVERTRKLMGPDYWPYGLEKNTDVLATLLRYMKDQGLIHKELKAKELFAPETLETSTFLD